jgi:hypothetical protein
MKRFLLLVLCGLVACGEGSFESEPLAEEVATLDTPELLCHPVAEYHVTPDGWAMLEAQQFWMFELGLSWGSSCRGKSTEFASFSDGIDCLRARACGITVNPAEIAEMIQPVLDGKTTAALLGDIPVEIFTEPSGRTQVYFQRHLDPHAVLGKLKETLVSATGSAASGDLSTSWQLPCCPGCAPCTGAQCDPRPSGPIRNSGPVFSCNCDQLCEVKDLPEPCECASWCNCSK